MRLLALVGAGEARARRRLLERLPRTATRRARLHRGRDRARPGGGGIARESARTSSSATSSDRAAVRARTPSTSSSAAISSSTCAIRRLPGAGAASLAREAARAHDAERRELGDSAEPPRRTLALHGARHPRSDARPPLHAQDADRGTRARRLSSRRDRLHGAACRVSRHAGRGATSTRRGPLRPSLFAYQFVVAAEPT